MNFAPYQDESPETERALSPPPADPNRSKSPRLQSPRTSSPAAGYSPSNPPPSNQYGSHGDVEGGRLNMAAFRTSLPIRMDIEAMLAYLLLPPAGGVFLLLAEHDSDYVRFHAWQSSMLFTALFIIHLLLAWSTVLSWILFVCDVGLIGFLSLQAYRDVHTLEHYEIPFFGRLANSFVDNE